MSSQKITYRPDIDGLRAIAVLMVVVFHAFPKFLPGGFVGVDIFFVISGYLITLIIISELKQGKFSIAGFYGRRILRIYPALSLVLLTVLSIGWLVLFPNEFKNLGKHVAGGAFFVSNLVLLRESGYFDMEASLKPLLHFWSLGIEEQYYIVFPALLLGLSKLRVRIAPWVIIFFALSLAASVWTTYQNASQAYYLPFTRVWELLSGSMLAFYKTRGYKENSPAMERLAAAFRKTKDIKLTAVFGLILIVISAIVIKKDSPFPGFLAMMPVAGSVLLIASNPNGWINRNFLASKLMVYVGLISFPLYLWHWPLLSFTRIINQQNDTTPSILAAIFLATVLSIFTYHMVELRLRRSKFRQSILISVLFSIVSVIGISGYFIYKKDGNIPKFSNQQNLINTGDVGHNEFNKLRSSIGNLCSQYAQHIDDCVPKKNASRDILVIFGDSHADHISLGLAKAFPNLQVVFFDALGLPIQQQPPVQVLLERIRNDPRIKVVIFSAYWSSRIPMLPPDVDFPEALKYSITELSKSGKQVAIATDVPNFQFNPEQCQYTTISVRKNACSEKIDRDLLKELKYQNLLAKVAKETNSSLINPFNAFCTKSKCSMSRDGKLLFRDKNHLNTVGTQYLGTWLKEHYPVVFEPFGSQAIINQ